MTAPERGRFSLIWCLARAMAQLAGVTRQPQIGIRDAGDARLPVHQLNVEMARDLEYRIGQRPRSSEVVLDPAQDGT